MLIGFIFMGLTLIVIGLIVKQHPNLLAGYNTMSDKKKKKIDIDRISIIARKIFLLMGAAAIDASIIMHFIEVSNKIQINIISGIVVLGLVVLILWSDRVAKLE